MTVFFSMMAVKLIFFKLWVGKKTSIGLKVKVMI